MALKLWRLEFVPDGASSEADLEILHAMGETIGEAEQHALRYIYDDVHDPTGMDWVVKRAALIDDLISGPAAKPGYLGFLEGMPDAQEG